MLSGWARSGALRELHVQEVNRAGDAGVVGANEHLQRKGHLLLRHSLVDHPGDQLPHVIIDRLRVLRGRDDAVGLHDLAAVVVGVVVEEDAARHLGGFRAPAFAQLFRDHGLLITDPLRQEAGPGS